MVNTKTTLDTSGQGDFYLPPATGQHRCYDENGMTINCLGSGQDGESRFGRDWPELRFEVHEDTVMDLLTGLIWLQNANVNEYPVSWQEALDLVAAMNKEKAHGRDDWRLPNRRELASLMSYEAKKPALPGGHPFGNVFLGWYWTSTTAAINPAYAWYLHLEGARLFYGRKDQFCLVWPVAGDSPLLAATGQEKCFDAAGKEIPCRGSSQDGELRLGLRQPNPRFETRDACVLDLFTGLVWLRNAASFPPMIWRQAFEAVEQLNTNKTGGRSDWRLPSINALETLVDCRRHSPALPGGHPFLNVGDTYWSSTTSFFETDWAWALYLQKGALGVGYKPETRFSVWPVCYR